MSTETGSWTLWETKTHEGSCVFYILIAYTIPKSLLTLNNKNATWVPYCLGKSSKKDCTCSMQMQFAFWVSFFLQCVYVCVLCMHMCIYVLACGGYHVYGCMCVCVHVESRDLCRESSLLALPPYSLGKGVPIKPRLPRKPRAHGYVSSWQTACSGAHLPVLSELKSQAGYHTHMAFTWVSGDLNSHSLTQNLLASV